jgi:BrnA antitoxin of type II toxin-antitoxin system
MKIGNFHRPIKRPVTVRIDADVLAWLKRSGPDYQPPSTPSSAQPSAHLSLNAQKAPRLNSGTDFSLSSYVLHSQPHRSFRTQQADAVSFTFASCERVGLRREKSLLRFVLSRISSLPAPLISRRFQPLPRRFQVPPPRPSLFFAQMCFRQRLS